MQNDNYKKIKSLFYIVAIISMVIAIFNKVHAEEMNQYYQNYINDYLSNNGYDTNIDLSTVYSECQYFTILTNHDYTYSYIYFTNNDTIGFRIGRYSSSYKNTYSYLNSYNWGGMYYGYVSTSSYNQEDSNNIKGYVLQLFIGNGHYDLIKPVPANNISNQMTTNPILYYCRTNNDIIFRGCNIGTIEFDINNSISNYNCYMYSADDNYVYNIEKNIDAPQYSTYGFSVFKYNNMGLDTIRFVPNGLVTIGSHYSNNPTLTFDLVIDDVTIPCSYNETSGFYYESLVYNKAFFEIPVSNFMPSSLDDFDNVYITNVVYINQWSNPSESSTDTFYYLDKCWLKRDVTSEDIGQVDITHIDTDTGYDSTVLNNIFQMITNASTLQGEFDEEKNLVGGSTSPISFSSFQDAVVKEIECWHPTGTKDSDWVSITIDGVTYDSGDNMYWLEYNNNSQQSFEHRYNYNISPYSYVRENNYSGYYDILYFIVHENIYDSSGSGFSSLSNSYTRYYYFISDRYYTKLMLYREMDIMEYIKLGNEGQEKIYNYLYDRLLNIDDNLYYYIKDKADIDNQILDAVESFDNSIEFALDDVLRVLNAILDALLNLNIQMPDVDLSDIESSLESIDNSLKNNEIDTVEECIKYFEENNNNGYPTSDVFEENRFSVWMSGKVHKWMQGSDPNIHIFRSSKIVDVFNTITNIYDSVIGGGNGFYITQYLDIISGADDGQSYHGYFNGMFDSNFDVTSYEGVVTVE